MQRLAICIGIVGLDAALSARTYKDESSALRSAVCNAAGLPESQADIALEALSAKNPGLLRSLLAMSGFTAQVKA